MFHLILIAASIGAQAPHLKVGSYSKEKVHLTQEMIIGISEDLIRADIAEVDIDPAVFDLPPEAKVRKKTALDDVDFNCE